MRWSEPTGVVGLPDDIERVKAWWRLTDDTVTDARELRDMILHAMGIVERHQRRQGAKLVTPK